MKPELVIDSKCIIGEGPVWDSETGKLYFIDILGRKMHCWNG
ncbi:MAG: SMP-30/gluconolactonase/LRE family protein, partial [Lentisphaeria bacterium]|nr:SMP-30/gluconolactonase/LRE family protein [Lentisphaeria bacterium]